MSCSRSRGPSQRDSLCEHTSADAAFEPAFRYNIDTVPEELLEVHDESLHIQQASAGFHLDEKIDVAARLRFAASNRSENANVLRAVLVRNHYAAPAFWAITFVVCSAPVSAGARHLNASGVRVVAVCQSAIRSKSVLRRRRQRDPK